MVSLNVVSVLKQERQKQKPPGAATASLAEESDAVLKAATEAATAVLSRASSRASSSSSSPSSSGNTLVERHAVAADVVDGVSYIPDFLTEEEEAALVAAVDLAAAERWIGGESSEDRFKSHSCSCSSAAADEERRRRNEREETSTTTTTTSSLQRRRRREGTRRTANFGGSPSRLLPSEPLPEFLRLLCEALRAAGAFGEAAPDFVLVNDFALGAGLPRHRDGPMYSASATISLLGSAALELTRVGKEGDDDDERNGSGGDDGNKNSSSSSKSRSEEKKRSSVQLLLRPRAALSLRREAYEAWEHGIPETTDDDGVGVDVVRRECANLKEARVAVGESVRRAERRISLVFVSKVRGENG